VNRRDALRESFRKGEGQPSSAEKNSPRSTQERRENIEKGGRGKQACIGEEDRGLSKKEESNRSTLIRRGIMMKKERGRVREKYG